MGVSSIKGFFGKFKAALDGEQKASSSTVNHQQAIGRANRKPNPTARGRRITTGAFGGVGTGRGRRGMPGRKLIKKTVKSGWSARYRVGLSVKPMVKAVTGGKA